MTATTEFGLLRSGSAQNFVVTALAGDVRYASRVAKIVVGIGGGIAAFKALDLVRHLTKQQHEVRVVMTQAATHFVGPVTFAGITGEPAVTDLWDPESAGEKHVVLSAWADLMIVAPATANLIARAAHGLADDAVLATIACADVPIVFAPAMHTRMWLQEVTQKNVATLEARGWVRVGPVRGALASGDVGIGRMAEAEELSESAAHVLQRRLTGAMQGIRVVITAGPTREPIDPVRFLSNHSSGKMGFAIAEEAQARGAEVVLVAGPTQIEPPRGVSLIAVETAQQMFDAVMIERGNTDVFIMTAAVSDYRPKAPLAEKVKKGEGPLTLTLVRNPDILETLGKEKDRAYRLVGFALETENVIERAEQKLKKKHCDLIVANNAKEAFGGNDTQVAFVSAQGIEPFERQSKAAVAHHILDWLANTTESQRVPGTY